MKVPEYKELRERMLAAYNATQNQQLKDLLRDAGAAMIDLFTAGKQAQVQIRRLEMQISKLERELKKK